MRYVLILLLLSVAAFAAPKMETRSVVSKGAKLTVVHTSAPW